MMSKRYGLFVFFPTLVFTSAFAEDTSNTSVDRANIASVRVLNLDAVQKYELSGRWVELGVQCFDLSAGTLTASAIYSANSPVVETTIIGESFYRLISSETCSVELGGRFGFYQMQGDQTGGYGIYSVAVDSLSILGGTTCTLKTALSSDGELSDLSRSEFTYTYAEGMDFAPVSTLYFYSVTQENEFLLVPAGVQVVDRPSDVCFLVSLKS